MGAGRAFHPAGQARRPPAHVREVLNGILYVLATGCQWRALPKDLPPKSTVLGYLTLWAWDGTFGRLHHALFVQVREQAGKDASPTAAIIDSQSVKGAGKGALASTRRASMRARRSGARSGTSWSTRSACCSAPRPIPPASRTATKPSRCCTPRAGCEAWPHGWFQGHHTKSAYPPCLAKPPRHGVMLSLPGLRLCLGKHGPRSPERHEEGCFRMASPRPRGPGGGCLSPAARPWAAAGTG